MVFSIVIGILASFLAGIVVPVSTGSFRTGGKNGLSVAPEVIEAIQERNAIQTSIEMISPTTIYEVTAMAILGTTSGFSGLGAQEFARTMSLAEALSGNWASIAALAVGLVICFAASYIMFLRTEIRPGD